MTFDSKYIITKEDSIKIKERNKEKKGTWLIEGKSSFMNKFWGVISSIIGIFMIFYSPNVANSLLMILLGVILLPTGLFTLFNRKNKFFVLLFEETILIKTVTDNCFLIPLSEINNIYFLNKKEKIYELQDIGANSAKEAINEYKLIIDSYEQKIDLSFTFTGIRINDLFNFLSKNSSLKIRSSQDTKS